MWLRGHYPPSFLGVAAKGDALKVKVHVAGPGVAEDSITKSVVDLEASRMEYEKHIFAEAHVMSACDHTLPL